jgi:hypothetical protein
MQTPQSIRSTQAMPSQASQLPQVTGPGFQDQVGYTAASLWLLILGTPSLDKPHHQHQNDRPAQHQSAPKPGGMP